MDRSIALLVIGLIFGGGIGLTLAAGSGVTLDGHDHADPAHHDGDVAHAAAMPVGRTARSASGDHRHEELLNLDPGSAPTLDIAIAPDPSTGWNLRMLTTDFSFAPEHASRGHVPGEGHAHVYVDGVKLGRFYGPWVHLGTLPAGKVEIAVTLNANDHRPLAVDGRPIAKSLVVEN